MQIINRFFLICFIAIFCSSIYANNLDATNVMKAYQSWCDAIKKARGHPEIVVKHYAPHAILLPTLSDKILFNDKNELSDYFAKLTSYKDIHCVTKKLITIMNSDDFATTAGFYDFVFIDKKGENITLHARFTFVYKKYNNGWLIVQHHSSVVPT